MTRYIAASCAALLLILAPAVAASSDFAYSGSLQYATGNYTLEQRTSSLYLFSGFGWRTGGWSAQASLPLVMQSQPYAVSGMNMEAGLGDAFLRAEREVVALRGGRPAIRLVGEVKAPLGRGLRSFGTGEWDFGGGVSLAQRWGANFAFVDATYWKFGDPEGVEFRDAVAYGISLGHPHGRVGILASITGYSRILAGVAPPVQAGLYLTYWRYARRSLSAGAVIGLTDAAPDVAVSLGWSIGL